MSLPRKSTHCDRKCSQDSRQLFHGPSCIQFGVCILAPKVTTGAAAAVDAPDAYCSGEVGARAEQALKQRSR